MLKTASPPGSCLFFYQLVGQTAFVHYAHFSVSLPPVVNRLRPFFCCLKSCKVQCFEQSLVAWEHATLTVELAVTGVQAFDGIRGVDDFSDIF